jgi:predicted  nucleic acid-binding Zn-ribbon protein
MMKLVRYTLAGLLFLTTSALAQPGPGQGPGPMREKIRERIKTIKIWRLTEAVELTSEQSEKFFPIYNKFQDAMENLEREKQETLQRLDSTTRDPESSDEDIRSLISQVGDFDRRSAEIRKAFSDDVSDVISIRQLGRLLAFEENFRRRLQETIRDIRREIGGGRIREHRP